MNHQDYLAERAARVAADRRKLRRAQGVLLGVVVWVVVHFLAKWW